MNHLELKNINKSFGDVNVVKDISLDIKKGEFVVFLGPSGCGKSTLLRLVAGLEIPDSGSIFLGQREITHVEAAQRDLAMVFQSYALYPHMTVKKNIGYPLMIRKKSESEINSEVSKVAQKLGLSDLLLRRPKQLSGGQRQRVALARAMIRKPQAFLMDEPLSNLDAGLRVQMRAELKHLHGELGATTLYVTHDQTEAMTLAQRIAVMKDGKILQFDTPKNIYNKPANIFVAQFVGSPSMNIIKGPFKTGTIEISDNQSLGVRPEDIVLSKVSKPHFLPAKVFVTEELGSESLVILDCGHGTRLTARVSPDFSVADHAQVWFSFAQEKTHIFYMENK